jgi:tetratricopeptide (TPR) repeat protein
MAGAVADAEACFERAPAISPDMAATWFALGQLLAETFKSERAKQCFERALALKPVNEKALESTYAQDHEQTISTLGFVLAEIGETEAALKILTTNTDQGTDVLRASHISLPRQVRSLLLLPQIYSSTDDLLRWRHRFSSGLEALKGANHDGADIWQIAQSNFLLAYQG